MSHYAALLNNGWRMDEIDRMDMLGYLKIRAWEARRGAAKVQPAKKYIDQIWNL